MSTTGGSSGRGYEGVAALAVVSRAFAHPPWARERRSAIPLKQRPQQSSRSIPNFAASASGQTTPSRPRFRTWESVMPLHKQMYIRAHSPSLILNCFFKNNSQSSELRQAVFSWASDGCRVLRNRQRRLGAGSTTSDRLRGWRDHQAGCG